MPTLKLPEAPVTRPFFPSLPDLTVVKSVPWRDWFDDLKSVFDQLAASVTTSIQAIQEGTHALRVSLAPESLPHTLFIETDRNRVVYESDGAHWRWFSGTINTTLGVGIAGLASSLGTYDAGLLAYAAAFDRTFQWTGTAFLEINARDRSIHMFAENPVTTGYALCDGSSVTRSRPDGSTYSWATPNLSGLYPKFGSTVGSNAAVAPTLHVSIPAGTLTHSHPLTADTGDAKTTGGDPWEVIPAGALSHRHNIALITGEPSSDGEGGVAPWDPVLAVSNPSITGDTGSALTTHAHGFSGTDSEGLPTTTVDAVAWSFELGGSPAQCAADDHIHGDTYGGTTSSEDLSHVHDGTGLSFNPEVVFNADEEIHFHQVVGETETGMDEFSYAGDAHHHEMTGDTDDYVQAGDLAITATAETNGQMANYVFKGYISL